MPTTIDAKFRPSINDTVRLSVELDGVSREIVVTREAVEDYLRLPPKYAAAYTQAQREDFVRRNLPTVIKAAKQMAGVHPDARMLVIGPGKLR